MGAVIDRVPAPWTTGEDAAARLTTLASEILQRCRGEGPANCVGRCPLHVDARGYVQLAKEGRYDEALQRVRETLPFPGILGYVCAHPCELHCKRVDDDSAIRIRDIKRFLAEREQGEPRHLLDREPDRGKKVAVVGAGPAGLLAAHDLRRRGYAVTVFERDDRIGGCLVQKLPPWRLPRPVIDRDLSIIGALGIEVRTGVAVGRDVKLDELRREFAAVVLFPGYAAVRELLRGPAGAGLDGTVEGTLGVDPVTLATPLEGVFAGGDAVTGPATVIEALAQGRRAAQSAHRYLEGLPLADGREAPLPARLLWTLENDEVVRKQRERTPVMLKPFNPPMSEEDVHAEAERCLDCTCGLCVQDCEFLKQYSHSPKDIARRVLAEPTAPDTLKMIYSCNLCELCKTVCPEKLDTGAMLLEARREAVRRGVGPLMPQHKPIVGYWKAGVSKLFTLAMPEPGRTKAKRLFFAGCGLPATAPRRTIEIYDALRTHYPGTGVMMWCCGAPVELIGMEHEHHQTKEAILRAAEALGAEELVSACPDCLHTLNETIPELKQTTIWELLAGAWTPPRQREGERISIHDSCKGRHFPELHGAVRKLLQDGGAQVEDVEYMGEKARCCGFGGMIYPVDAALSQKITKRRGDESTLPMVTYCAGCRTALKGCGKDSIHITEFLLGSDWRKAATDPSPGSIPRYINRLKTKWAFKRLRPLPAK